MVVSDVNEKAARSVAEDIHGLAVPCDVSREAEIQELVRAAEEAYGPIDLFCSNAGIIAIGGVECPNEQWQRIWEINVLAHVYAGRAVIPGMIARVAGPL